MAKEPTVHKEDIQAPDKKPNKMMMIAGIIAGILVLEGAIVFVAVKMIGKGPAEAVGIENPAHPRKDRAENTNEQTEEIVIANQFECPHTNTGRLYVIRMTIYASVPKILIGSGAEPKGEKEGKEGENPDTGIQKEIEKRIASIKDRMRTVIASADASTLCLARSEKPDYGLSTLRRQFKTILDDVLGKGKVKDVLISDYMPTPVD
ncbi:MAG: hypothetical protein WC975_10470 [Phycisphaerae bacterium]